MSEKNNNLNNYTETLPGGVKLEMIAICAGKFMMGSNDYEKENPIHRVTLKEFYLGKYPITQSQYQAIMEENPSEFKGENRPVENVSWNMAQKFCQRLSEKTGKKYRLPSESQWEYACRAVTDTKYFFGNSDSDLDKYAWYDYNSNEETHPVGEKRSNQWGIYDILGNVWEWCEDDYVENYHNAPNNGNSYIKPSTILKVLRGGSWYDLSA